MKIPPVTPEPTVSGWYATINPPIVTPALGQDISCDWLIIGGGWMGLHAAKRLSDLDKDAGIVLVDAGKIGNNAAGRCAGFAIDLAHNPRKKDFAEDVVGNKEENHTNLEGVNYIREAVETLNIDCDWSPEGKYHSAATHAGINALKSFGVAMDRLGEPYDWLGHDEISDITGTRHYKKALFAPGTVLLQPAAYISRLAQKLRKNIDIYENTAVTNVKYDGERHMCKTPGGIIRPRKIMLCNNGFLSQFGLHTNTAIPLYTFASLTRPLTGSQSAAIGGRRTFGVIPADSFGTTLRRTADDRLFLRNTYRYGADFKSPMSEIERVKANHQCAFDRRYPQISAMGYEYTWGGMMTLALNGGMVFGLLGKNVYGTGFCNGTGVARGAAFGKALAELAMGKISKTIEILKRRAAPSRVYPKLITQLGVNLTSEWRLRKAGMEV